MEQLIRQQTHIQLIRFPIVHDRMKDSIDQEGD